MSTALPKLRQTALAKMINDTQDIDDEELDNTINMNQNGNNGNGNHNNSSSSSISSNSTAKESPTL